MNWILAIGIFVLAVAYTIALVPWFVWTGLAAVFVYHVYND